MLGLDPLATATVLCIALAAAALLGAELLHLTRSRRQAAAEPGGEGPAPPTWGIIATGVLLTLAIILAVGCAAMTLVNSWW
jgi:hypothetical protein